MKKYFLAPIVTAIVLSSVAYAQTDTTVSSTTRETKWAEMDARRSENRAKFEERRTELQSRQTAVREDLAKRKLVNTVRLMRAAIERLENAIKRIEARIAQVDEKGGDTTEAERYIALAKTDLGKAKEVVEAFSRIEPTGFSLQENFERIRTAAAQARELIRSAHKNTMSALRALMTANAQVDDSDDDSDNDEDDEDDNDEDDE